MARRFSSKHAFLIDDRTGRKIKYRDARTEWTGARVHKSEFETKHPQLTPPRVIRADPKPLHNPRPDNDDMAVNVDFNQVGREGVSTYLELAVIRQGQFQENGSNILIDPEPAGFGVTSSLGTAVATITLQNISVTGIAATMTLDNEALVIEVIDNIPSFIGSMSLGSVTIETDSGQWGADTWGANLWGQ